MRLEVDSGSYTSACGEFYDANHGIVDAVTALVGGLSSSGGMAGTDTGGEAFATQYDPAAAALVEGGSDLGEAMAVIANLLNTSLVNHDGADKGAQVYGPPLGNVSTGDDNPDHYTESISTSSPPSARGGTGDEPDWWHWIASHVGGLLWPDADTGKLRTVGDAWKNAGTEVSGWKYSIESAQATMESQRSPEIADVVATCTDLASHLDELSTGFTTIGQACQDYADQVAQHHQEVEDELKSFIEWTIAIEAGGVVLGALTLGIGEAAAQAAEAGEVANAAQKVIRILNDLIELARLGASKIGELLSRVAEIGPKIKKILSARMLKAVEQVGEDIVKVDLDTLPAWAEGGAIPETRAFEGMTEADRYGGLSKQEFFDKYWDAEKGGWRYPENDGFLGERAPNSLEVGQRIDRFGPHANGQYASPAGESYGSRAIPPSNIGREYHEFEVVKPLPRSVTEGEIAPWFEQPGGGTQYFFDHDMDWYVEQGYLKEIH